MADPGRPPWPRWAASVSVVSTAPEAVRFCVSCAAPMATSEVRGVARRTCSVCGRIHYVDPKVAVGVAVFRDDALLLVRRTMDPARGLWALPGGFLDAGEHPTAAAARETLEESGVRVTVGAVLDVFVNPPEEGGVVFLLYAADWLAGEPTPGDDTDAAGFFRRTELPPLAFASTAAAVARWPASTQG